MIRNKLVKELKDRQVKGEKNLIIVNLRIVQGVVRNKGTQQAVIDENNGSIKCNTVNNLQCMYANMDCLNNKKT